MPVNHRHVTGLGSGSQVSASLTKNSKPMMLPRAALKPYREILESASEIS